MYIFLGQPFITVSTKGPVEQKIVNNQPVKVIRGEHFTYYVKTKNGIVTEVKTRSIDRFAPASYFIQNVENCTKKSVLTVPLRMAVWHYECPQGKFEYKRSGTIGDEKTEVKMLDENCMSSVHSERLNLTKLFMQQLLMQQQKEENKNGNNQIFVNAFSNYKALLHSYISKILCVHDVSELIQNIKQIIREKKLPFEVKAE